MTREELCKMVGELSSAVDETRAYADSIIAALGILSDSEWQNTPSVKSFIKCVSLPESRLDNKSILLREMHSELCMLVAKKQQQIKGTAIGEMRKTKKINIVIAISVLGIVAVIALVCGVLSAFDIIPAEWCNVIGVFDCAFGILFFAYELYDDKLKSTAISNGDVKTIEKYYTINIKTGKAHSKKGVANSGIVFGCINNGIEKEDLRKIMGFDPFDGANASN